MLDVSRHPYMELSTRVMAEALKMQAETEVLRPILEAQSRGTLTPVQKRDMERICTRLDKREQKLSAYLCQ